MMEEVEELPFSRTRSTAAVRHARLVVDLLGAVVPRLGIRQHLQVLPSRGQVRDLVRQNPLALCRQLVGRVLHHPLHDLRQPRVGVLLLEGDALPGDLQLPLLVRILLDAVAPGLADLVRHLPQEVHHGVGLGLIRVPADLQEPLEVVDRDGARYFASAFNLRQFDDS